MNLFPNSIECLLQRFLGKHENQQSRCPTKAEQTTKGTMRITKMHKNPDFVLVLSPFVPFGGLSLNVQRTDNGQMRKVNLKIQGAFGHTAEIEFSPGVRGSGLQFFSILQKMKPDVGETFTPP